MTQPTGGPDRPSSHLGAGGATPPPAPGVRGRPASAWAQNALLLIGGALVLAWGVHWMDARAFQARASRELDVYAGTVRASQAAGADSLQDDAEASGEAAAPRAAAPAPRGEHALRHAATSRHARAAATAHARAARGRDAHGDRRGGRAAGESATRALARRSGIVGRVEVPRLGIRAVIAEGTSHRVLSHAVGHVRWTPLPGEPGNVGLTAHRDSYFRNLANVRRGDLVQVVTPDGTFRYRVTRTQVVPPSRVAVLRQDRGSGVTLVTCWPFRWIGPAPRRFVVSAAAEPSADLRAAR